MYRNETSANWKKNGDRSSKLKVDSNLHIAHDIYSSGTAVAKEPLNIVVRRTSLSCRIQPNFDQIPLENLENMRPVKHFEKGLTYVARGAFAAVRSINQFKPNPSFTPKWSDKPLLKSWQKSKPTLGFPRMTDSLCPNCVIEARESILSGEKEVSMLINDKVGEIKAQIIERDGQVWMIKDCPEHGHFEDMMAIDSKFLQHIESLFPGRDIESHNDEKLHNHGTSSSNTAAELC